MENNIALNLVTKSISQLFIILVGHAQYGEYYPRGRHASWSAKNPIHIVGHSYGATTAIELYQLVCKDFFNVGSNRSWILSITSVSGPLTGKITPIKVYIIVSQEQLWFILLD